MEVLFSVTALKDKMANPPKGQQLYNFFNGAINSIDEDQKEDLISILNKNHKEVVDFIEASILECKEDKNDA